MKKCTFITLGCKVNQYETQALREAIIPNGYKEVSTNSAADLYVINTCTVTSSSDEKSRQQIKRVIRKNPDARVVVTGCSAEVNAEKIRKIDGVDGVFEKGQENTLVDFVKSDFVLTGNSEGVSDPALESHPDAVQRKASKFPLNISRFERHTRAFLKIEDGCDNFCSYCIIPYVRGDISSKSIRNILVEAERLVANGYKEIVLTGIHLGAYGKDNGYQFSIIDVLNALQNISGLMRIRLSSIEVNEVTDGLIDLVANSEKICPHFHMPLQSGDDSVLKKMNRKYSTFQYLNTLEKIREKIELPSISTDVMVGFPGEKAANFNTTRRFCEKVGFSGIHIFPFSPREGTPASRMPDRCTPSEVKARKKELEFLKIDSSLKYTSSFIGKKASVLVENKKDTKTGKLCGYSDRYIKVLFSGTDDLMKTIVNVRIEKVSPGFVFSKFLSRVVE